MPARAVALLIAIAAVVLPAPSAGAAGPPIMRLADVQPGMHCSVASVIQGTTISTFDARIDDLLRSRDPRGTRILVTFSGPAVDATGIGPGFSGSPLTCTGADGVPRIAAAISEGIGQYGGLRGLATPIEAILGEPADPPAGAKVATALLRRARPLGEPHVLSGLTPALARAFTSAAARAHQTLITAPATALAAQAPLAPLVPGSSVAASTVTGDLSSSAIGTVAYVDGDRVWAFGHELDGAGRRSLTLSSAYVYTVVSNPVASREVDTYKLAAPLDDIGTLVQDGVDGVVGRLGPLPRRFPVRVVSLDTDRNRRTEIAAQVADERPVGMPAGGSLAPLLAGVVAQAAYTTLQGVPAQMSARLCVRIAIQARTAPLSFCNTYVGIGGGSSALAESPLVIDAGSAGKLLDAFDAGPLAITGITAGLRLTRSPRLGTLVRAEGPAVVRRGTTVAVRLTLRRVGGGRFTRTIRVAVPATMPAGPRDLLLTGTPADGPAQGGGLSLSDLFGSGAEAPAAQSLTDLAKAVSALHHDDALGARFVPVGAQAPTRLPGGSEGIAQRRRPVFRSDTLRIAGRARVRFDVR